LNFYMNVHFHAVSTYAPPHSCVLTNWHVQVRRIYIVAGPAAKMSDLHRQFGADAPIVRGFDTGQLHGILQSIKDADPLSLLYFADGEKLLEKLKISSVVGAP